MANTICWVAASITTSEPPLQAFLRFLLKNPKGFTGPWVNYWRDLLTGATNNIAKDRSNLIFYLDVRFYMSIQLTCNTGAIGG